MAQKKAAAAAKKPAAKGNKRGPKPKQVVEEKPKEVEPSEDESEEEQNGVNADDGSNSEAEGAANLIDSEAEEAEDDDEEEDEDDDEDEDEDEDEDADEVEPGEVSKTTVQEDDSDEEPTEAPISKKTKAPQAAEKKEGGIPKVRIGRIPPDTPKEQLIYVSHLPEKYKHVEVVALFAKFGKIKVVNRIKTKAGGNSLQICFESAESAEAALSAKPKAVTLGEQVLNVSRPLDTKDLNERTVAVGLLGASTSKEQVTEHFKKCGEVEAVNFSNNRQTPTAYVRFVSLDSVAKALDLNGSQLNSRYITVREGNDKKKTLRSPDLTLLLTNTGAYESFKTETIETIFKKYGKIIDLDVVCTRSILAFVTFETAEETQKALKELNGKTIDGLQIKIQRFYYNSSVRTVLVTNLANDVDEKLLEATFADSGEIENIKIFGHKALVKFTTDEGFCKSFLNNERFLLGQPIFLEPNSLIKLKLLQKKAISKGFKPNQKFGGNRNNQNNNNWNKNGNNKRPFNKGAAQNNGSAPPFKKSKKF